MPHNRPQGCFQSRTPNGWAWAQNLKMFRIVGGAGVALVRCKNRNNLGTCLMNLGHTHFDTCNYYMLLKG